MFAHQDDEFAAAARITHVLQRGDAVSIVYLTDGQGRGATSAQRDEESRIALRHLGVDLARVHFLGSEHHIPDGRLVAHLDRALALLEERVSERVDEVVCLAWEGGHHDHDASHLIAAAFARRRGIPAIELPLYQGYRGPRWFFRTITPLRIGNPWSARSISLREALRILALCRFYRSQRKTWIGLLPMAILRLILGRREWTRAVDLARLHAPPHEGVLFYERRFGVTWTEFEELAREFIARELR